MTTFIQQVVGLSDTVNPTNSSQNTYAVVNMLPDISTGSPGTGTGFVSGDVGAIVTLTGGTYTTQAQAMITSVSGGKITGLSMTQVGYYTTLPTGLANAWSISGGSGTNAKVCIDRAWVPELVRTGNIGFSTPLTSFTACAWVTTPAYSGGLINNTMLLTTFSGSLFFGGLILSVDHIDLLDSNGNPIFYGAWNYDSAPVGPTAAYCLMVSVNTSTQTLQVYINDSPATVFPPQSGEGIWHSSNPIRNTAAADWHVTGIPFGGIGGGALISLWVAEGYNDLSNAAYRRNFINSDLRQIDPATYPSAQINLYTEPGDSPSAFATNHGTGGALTLIGGPLRWAKSILTEMSPFSFLTTSDHTFSVDGNTTLNATVSGQVGALGPTGSGSGGATDFTYRPFASLSFAHTTSPSNGSLTFNSDGSFSYTPSAGWSGTDTFTYTATEAMPSPAQAPGYSATQTVTINVSPPPPTPELKLVSLYAFEQPDSSYGFYASSDFPDTFSQFSISVWCCRSVHIQSPKALSAYGVMLDFSPTTISISLHDVDDTLRFAGTWSVTSPTIEYQVLFSVDTQAQTYALYVNDQVAAGSPTWGASGSIGFVSGFTTTPFPSPEQWTVTSKLSAPSEGGIGDLRMDQAYIDYSNLGTRRLFINGDKSWVFLGEYADVVVSGTYPLVWNTVQAGNDPDDFIYGYGQAGGADGWNLMADGNDPTTGSSYPPDLTFDACTGSLPPVVMKGPWVAIFE
jgi:hypothetical protein